MTTIRHIVLLLLVLSTHCALLAQTNIIIKVDPFSFPAEIHWELLDSAGAVVFQRACDSYGPLTVDTLNLNNGEIYTFHALDDFGDGWNGGTYSIELEGGCVLSSGIPNNGLIGDNSLFCDGSDLEESFSFDPAGDIVGCTDSLSPNYNPCAVIDDGSCLITSSNDECADAILCPLAGDDCLNTASATNVGATFSASAGSPSSSCPDLDPAPLDVWFKVAVPASGRLRATLVAMPGFSSIIEFYSGSCDSLVNLTASGVPCQNFQPVTLLGLSAIDTLYLRVWDFESDQFGEFELCCDEPSIGCTDPCAVNYDSLAIVDDGSCFYASSVNDECGDAIFASAGDNPFSSCAATGLDVTSCTGTNDTASVWFAYVVQTGVDSVYFNTCDADYDTGLSLWTACDGTEIACNDDDAGFGGLIICEDPLTSSLRMLVDDSIVAQGDTIYVRIAGFGGANGSGNLNIQEFTEACNKDIPPANPTTTIVGAGVVLSWDPVTLSVACQVNGGAEGGGSANLNSIGFEVSSKFVSNSFLSPGVNYIWKVRCACSLSPTLGTDFSIEDTFSLPLLKETTLDINNITVDLYPNPVSANLSVKVNNQEKAPISLRITDLLGHEQYFRKIERGLSSTVLSIPVHNFPDGVYILGIRSADYTINRQFIVAN